MSQKNRYQVNDIGVSEVVGFIIIMGIMMTGIALVTLYGYPAIMKEQENANIKNMEKNMIVLQNDVKSLVYKSDPYKETTIQVSGGVLSVESPDDTTKSFTINDDDGVGPLLPNPPFSNLNRFSPGGLKFLSESGAILISLQNGAVVKHQSDGSVMLAEPRWFIDETVIEGAPVRTLVITLIQIDTDPSGKPMATSGNGVVQMTVKPLNLDGDNILEYGPFDPGHQITLEYKDTYSDYRTAWKNYFGQLVGTQPQNPVTVTVNWVIIKAYEVTIENL